MLSNLRTLSGRSDDSAQDGMSSADESPDLRKQLRRRKHSTRDVMDRALVKKKYQSYLNAPWYIVRPMSRFMSVWDALTSLALLFTAAITPFEVAFLEGAESTTDGLFIANRMLDCIFSLDMVLQFFLMYRVGSDEGGGTQYEYRQRYIAAHYVKTWFFLDLGSILPSLFDILPWIPDSGMSPDSSTSNLRVLRVIRTTRLLKLVRLVRSSRLFQRLQVRLATRAHPRAVDVADAADQAERQGELDDVQVGEPGAQAAEQPVARAQRLVRVLGPVLRKVGGEVLADGVGAALLVVDAEARRFDRHLDLDALVALRRLPPLAQQPDDRHVVARLAAVDQIVLQHDRDRARDRAHREPVHL